MSTRIRDQESARYLRLIFRRQKKPLSPPTYQSCEAYLRLHSEGSTGAGEDERHVIRLFGGGLGGNIASVTVFQDVSQVGATSPLPQPPPAQ